MQIYGSLSSLNTYNFFMSTALILVRKFQYYIILSLVSVGCLFPYDWRFLQLFICQVIMVCVLDILVLCYETIDLIYICQFDRTQNSGFLPNLPADLFFSILKQLFLHSVQVLELSSVGNKVRHVLISHDPQTSKTGPKIPAPRIDALPNPLPLSVTRIHKYDGISLP